MARVRSTGSVYTPSTMSWPAGFPSRSLVVVTSRMSSTIWNTIPNDVWGQVQQVLAAEGCTQVLLGVEDDNEQARALYERLGYRPVDGTVTV